jgi:hypothetical protein
MPMAVAGKRGFTSLETILGNVLIADWRLPICQLALLTFVIVFLRPTICSLATNRQLAIANRQ